MKKATEIRKDVNEAVKNVTSKTNEKIVINFGRSYIALQQYNHDDNESNTVVVAKDQIDDVIKHLQSLT